MIKKLLVLSLAACIATVATAETNMAKLYKDTEIMRNILVTSLKQNNERGGIRFNSVDSTYLEGQGLVFEVKTNTGGWKYNFGFGDMFGVNTIVAPTPPDAPEVVVPNVIFADEGEAYRFEFENVQELTREALEVAREALKETREKFKELRQQERELNWENRELERRLRDIEFQLRHADQESSGELREEKREVSQEKEKLEAKRQEIAKFAEELEQQEKEAREKQQEEEQRKIKSFLAAFEATVAETLCSYGGGLRDLPDDEKVNFILKNFAERETTRGRDKMDKVYVFTTDDVKSCVADKMDENELLSSAKTYLF